MRIPRHVIIDHGRTQYFHVVSRVVDKRFIFEPQESGTFFQMMRQFEAFSGVKVHAYCIMSNHFHILLQVPVRSEPILENEVRQRMENIYNKSRLAEFDEYVRIHRESGREELVERFYDTMRRRMYNLPIFIKDLKQKFTRWYNIQHKRKGTLWEERYKALLVQGSENALLKTAAYIELNPIRAGMVDDPKDYKWCSYAEAVAGGKSARSSIITLVSGPNIKQMNWNKAREAYREYLHNKGCEQSGSRRGMTKGKLVDKHGSTVKRTSKEAMRGRVRYFTDGLVIGSQEFIKEFFERKRNYLNESRKVICRAMKGADWEGLCSFRDVSGGS
jgi:REP element-mobilizing transposase RayT